LSGPRTNPRNGELLAIASLPTVDLNNYGRSPVYNRLFSAVQLAYECDLLPSLVTFCSMTEQKKHNVSLPRISRTALSRVTDSESVYSLMLKFGLDQPTGIAINGETGGITPSKKLWNIRSKISLPKIAISPLQLVVAMGAIANDACWSNHAS